MPISSIIDSPLGERREEVVYKKETYVVVGRPNANSIEQVLMIPETKKETLAAHFSKICGADISADSIPRIAAVAMTLQHEGDPNDRYDIAEIAKLSDSDGVLFLQLVGAAFKCLGLVEGENPDEPTAIEIVAEKNSSTGAENLTLSSATQDTAQALSS